MTTNKLRVRSKLERAPAEKLSDPLGSGLGVLQDGWATVCTQVSAWICDQETRSSLNAKYHQLSFAEKALCHALFAKLFRDSEPDIQTARWRVHFGGSELQLPLTRGRMWLDWDSALSILGHDIEVKLTYESLLASSGRPDLFIDIGANYGTHSLLFLSQQVRTVTFEPNQTCHAYMLECCSLNSLTPEIRSCSLGESSGETSLWYPKDETWLGTTQPIVRTTLEQQKIALFESRVQQKTLDELVMDLSPAKILIKIDTEGSEVSVLKGAESCIARHRPLIIFECHAGEQRHRLLRYFEPKRYRLYSLPWNPTACAKALRSNEFACSDNLNFVAVPD